MDRQGEMWHESWSRGPWEKQTKGTKQVSWAALGKSPCLMPLEPQFPCLCWEAWTFLPLLSTVEEEAEAQGGEG